MKPLGIASRHPEQSRDRIFGDGDQPSGGSHPASFPQMVANGRRLVLRDLGVESGGATSFGARLATRLATEEPEAVLAIDCAHREIGLACETKPLAVGVDTR
jgi:hypothetical protein